MNKSIFVIATALIGALSLQAQDSESLRPDLGFKVGIPVADMFNPGTGFSSHTPRYTFGVTGEFHLPKNLRFEIDGLYKRGGFNSALPWQGGGLAYRPTTLNWWEIPGLFKYNFSAGHLRPFVDFGASLRHISTINQTTYAAGLFNGFTTSDNSIALHNRNSFGGVAGIGITFKMGPVKLSPEARYTRWANEAFQTNGLRTNLDQGDILLGITF
jgi:Outer membrane protein beta-barrel domain